MTNSFFVLGLIFSFFLCQVTAQAIPVSTLQTQALYSFAAYCQDRVTAAWDCYWCQKLPSSQWVSNFGKADTAAFGYVAIAGGSTIQIVWRGSANIDAWIKNVQVLQREYPGVSGASVHTGFYNTWNATHAQVLSIFRQAVAKCPKCTQVAVTGHSLGGALATLTAAKLTSQTPLHVSLYTFGSPRVGNPKFSEYVHGLNLSQQFRATNARDPVPHLPAKAFSYQHVFREMWSKSSSQNILCSNTNRYLSAQRNALA